MLINKYNLKPSTKCIYAIQYNTMCLKEGYFDAILCSR